MTDAITETVGGAAKRTRVAVVLARGLGTRMRASSPAGSGLTSQQATAAASGYKALMPIGEHRLIDYSLSALVDAGIERAVLVVGPEHEDFRRHIDSLELTRLTIDLAVQVNPLGTADAVLSAEAAVGGEPFLMVNGDNYYPRQVLRDLARHRGNALAGFERAALVAESNIPAERIAAFAHDVERVLWEDGCKVYFTGGGWVTIRFSGTEPLLRVFAEMPTGDEARATAAAVASHYGLDA